ncbi:MAG: class II fructose-bisphosphate aldolase [Planctomycetaceae bacterium]|nr:class II fructose-bisphosphate aldolase [Planctomycetaceae bacterium]
MKEFTTLKDMLAKAQREKYAVAGFNFCNAETAQVVFSQAVKLRSPAMLIASSIEVRLCGMEETVKIVKLLAGSVDVPVCLHLDHTDDVDTVCRAVDAGFSSVMIDGSHFPFERNIEMTQAVVQYAHNKGVSVEGELGAIGENKDALHEGVGPQSLTDPDMAAEFVERTGVDALAVSIGNAHGFYAKRPRLDFDLLQAIASRLEIPLVLHGGSGTPVEHLQKAISLGICKVNVASEIGKAFTDSYIQTMSAGGTWWIVALQKANDAIAPVIERWIRNLGSEGKA